MYERSERKLKLTPLEENILEMDKGTAHDAMWVLRNRADDLLSSEPDYPKLGTVVEYCQRGFDQYWRWPIFNMIAHGQNEKALKYHQRLEEEWEKRRTVMQKDERVPYYDEKRDGFVSGTAFLGKPETSIRKRLIYLHDNYHFLLMDSSLIHMQLGFTKAAGSFENGPNRPSRMQSWDLRGQAVRFANRYQKLTDEAFGGKGNWPMILALLYYGQTAKDTAVDETKGLMRDEIVNKTHPRTDYPPVDIEVYVNDVLNEKAYIEYMLEEAGKASSGLGRFKSDGRKKDVDFEDKFQLVGDIAFMTNKTRPTVDGVILNYEHYVLESSVYRKVLESLIVGLRDRQWKDTTEARDFLMEHFPQLFPWWRSAREAEGNNIVNNEEFKNVVFDVMSGRIENVPILLREVIDPVVERLNRLNERKFFFWKK